MTSGIKGPVDLTSPAYIAIRGVNPPPHVVVRMQTHPHEFPEREPDDAIRLHNSFQLPLIGRTSPDQSMSVPMISAGEFARGVSTLFACVRKSFKWKSADIIDAVAGWWNAPVKRMIEQCNDDTFARQVYAISPEISQRVWDIDEGAISCASIVLTVADMFCQTRMLWRGRWENLFTYKERVEMVSLQMGVSSDHLYSLVSDADILAALNGEKGETSYVGDFIGYPSPLRTVRAPEVEEPERFLSLAATAKDLGFASYHYMMFFIGSQGLLHASEHPYPITHASIKYRRWYNDYLWNTDVGRLIGSPSMPRGMD